MQLGPMPGTQLYRDYDKKGILRKDIPFEEWHGQHRIWFSHPNFTPKESESYLRAAFRHDYDTRGPSFLRMCDTLMRGYRYLARYDDPAMVVRREQLRERAQHWRPSLAAQRSHAHNDHARSMADAVIADYDAQLGPPSLKQKIFAVAVRVLASMEAARSKMPQPKTITTAYRGPLDGLAPEQLEGRRGSNLLDVRIDWARVPLLVELAGTMDRVNSRVLARKVVSHLRRESGKLLLSLDHLVAIEDRALERLLDRVKRYRGRIEVALGEGTDSVRNALASLPLELSGLVAQGV